LCSLEAIRPAILSGISSDIIDTRGTIGVFNPAPSGVVEILDADIRD